MELRSVGTCILLLTGSGCAGWTLRVPTRAEQAAEAARGLPEPDLSAAPFDEAAALSPADRLFERHLESIGGRKAIEGHTSARIIAQGTLLPGGDRVDVEERRKAPDQRLVLVDVHGVGSAAHGFDGRTAWATSTQYGGARYGPEETWRQRRIATFHAAARYAELYPERRVIGDVVWEGMAVTQVHVGTAEGTTATLYFARDTGLLAGEEWWATQVPATGVRLHQQQETTSRPGGGTEVDGQVRAEGRTGHSHSPAIIHGVTKGPARMRPGPGGPDRAGLPEQHWSNTPPHRVGAPRRDRRQPGRNSTRPRNRGLSRQPEPQQRVDRPASARRLRKARPTLAPSNTIRTRATRARPAAASPREPRKKLLSGQCATTSADTSRSIAVAQMDARERRPQSIRGLHTPRGSRPSPGMNAVRVCPVSKWVWSATPASAVVPRHHFAGVPRWQSAA